MFTATVRQNTKKHVPQKFFSDLGPRDCPEQGPTNVVWQVSSQRRAPDPACAHYMFVGCCFSLLVVTLKAETSPRKTNANQYFTIIENVM